jgi:hypothetical protein
MVVARKFDEVGTGTTPNGVARRLQEIGEVALVNLCTAVRKYGVEVVSDFLLAESS